MPQKMTASDLDKLFREAKEVDNAIFAEMRSNLLLIAGKHYQNKGSKYWERIRDNKELTEQQKLRLVKNHIKKISDGIKASILSHAPNTKVLPVNQTEVQDQKAAELNHSVLEFYKKQLGMRGLIRNFASDYVDIGEVCAKVFWDNDLGDIKGYAPVLDEQGNPLVSIDTGEPKTEVIMSGAPVVERVFGFNLLRDPEVQDMKQSTYLIVVKLVHQNIVKRLSKNPDIINSLDKTAKDEFLVFDSTKGSYSKEKEHVIIREHFYRPCKEYPKGYYYIAIENGILKEGELPDGIWPLIHRGYDQIATAARSFSPIKQMRPGQIEINRAQSTIATSQVVSGDKLVMKNGSKMTSAGQLHGTRGINVTGGGEPMIMKGASGEQYIPYLDREVNELYQLNNQFESDEFRDGKLDPYALLYFSMRNKNKFSAPGEVFEEFVVELTETLLRVIKHYIPEDVLIPIIGKNEMANISEFKNTTPNKYKIQVEAVSTDIDTMLGKQLAINHTLQYVGQNMDKKDIGRMLRAMPFMNQEEAYGDLTIDYDNVKNDILSLERGQIPQANIYDNHDYIIQRIVHRMKQADYKILPPEIQQAFEQYKMQHEEMAADRIQAIQRAQQGLIPTDGYMAKCDLYMTTPDGKTTRVVLPSKAIEWLIGQLDAQGNPLAQLDQLSNQTLNQISNNNGAATPGQNQVRGGNPATNGVING
jgi:hypothetical protein